VHDAGTYCQPWCLGYASFGGASVHIYAQQGIVERSSVHVLQAGDQI
jgi:hypothetical protein